MEGHTFKQGPNGLCEICGNTREKCMMMEIMWSNNPAENAQMAATFAKFDQMPERCKVAQIACTKFNTFLLSTGGIVYSWGETTNALGRQLAKREHAQSPMPVDNMKAEQVSQIATGDNHVLALTQNGQVYSWGVNRYGQLGLRHAKDTEGPTIIKSIQKINHVYAGANCSFAVSIEGDFYAWGENKNFQLGISQDTAAKKDQPQQIVEMPWEKSAEINIVADKRGKHYAFASRRSSTQASGPSGTSVSNSNQRKMIDENEDLKRRNERLNERINFLEEEMYGQKVQTSANVWDKDPLLTEISSTLVKLTKQKKQEFSQHKLLEIEIQTLNKEIKQQIEDGAKAVKLEEELWQVIDGIETNIRNIQFQNYDENEHATRSLQEQMRDKRKEVEISQESRSKKMALLVSNESLLREKQLNLERLEESIDQNLKKTDVYNQLEEIRKKDLSYEFFEKNQNSVETDLANVISLHDALSDTSVEYLSRTMFGKNLRHVVTISNRLIEKVKQESIRLQKPDEAVFSTLNQVWKVLQKNAELRLKINAYTEGLIMSMSQNLANTYHERHENGIKKADPNPTTMTESAREKVLAYKVKAFQQPSGQHDHQILTRRPQQEESSEESDEEDSEYTTPMAVTRNPKDSGRRKAVIF